MNRSIPPCCIALLVATAFAGAEPAADPVIAKQLAAYYEKGAAPPWADAIKRLTAQKPAARADAAKYLVSLLNQAQVDELSGKAPWRATPFWGGGGENPARNLRESIAKVIAKAQASTETLTVVSWFLDREKVASFQVVVFPAVAKVKGRAADDFCVKLLQPPHKNSAVALAAIQEVARRNTPLTDAVLMPLCNHYRPSLRTASRKLNQELSRAEPKPFDGALAMRGPAITALMTTIGTLLDQPPSPDAEFVTVTTSWTDGENDRTSTKRGWLVKNDGDTWDVLTPFGQRESFVKTETIKLFRGGERIITCRWDKLPIADEVQRIVALRAEGDPEFELSERGGLTGQFEGRAAGVYEVMLAHWLYAKKQYDLSSQVFLPALDTLYLDQHMVEMIRHRMGELVGNRMLVAFIGDRDFPEAARLANAIVERYPETRSHADAVKLSKEIPKRLDDFKKFKLPTPEQWAEQKARLSRAEQIAFLAERVRLLNCFQMGQPGGYSVAEEQYAEPCGLSDNAAWGLGRGVTRVINPYVELVGGREEPYDDDGEEKKPSPGMQLTVADIPTLAQLLRDNWHILCVSFWRDFHPERDLETTRPMFANIINGLAKRDLCNADAMNAMTEAEIDVCLAAIVRWAKENADLNEADLLWDGLSEDVKNNARWPPGNIHKLVELKDNRVLPVLQKYLDTTESEYDLHSLLYTCLRYDPTAFKSAARKFAKHKVVDVQLAAGHILFAGGERAEGTKIFASVLERGSPWQLEEKALPALIDTLLKEGSDESKRTAALIFKNKLYPEIPQDWVRVHLVDKCAEAGIGDGYLSYLPLLDIKGTKIGNTGYAEGTRVGHVIAAEIIGQLAPEDPEIQRIKKEFPNAADQIEPLKAWLKAKAKAVQTKDQR